MTSFTHLNQQGHARMVDVSEKETTKRTAVAYSQIAMKDDVWQKVKNQDIEKGDVLSVAQVAGIMAAKKTSDLIPMCHPLFLSGVDITFEYPETGVIAFYVKVKTTGRTGVEMEALSGASAVGLTIYDMCKALDQTMEIGPTYLVEKEGGRSGSFRRSTHG